jgi:flagellar biosynthesis/type III secretory pathway protein FliH
MSAIIKSGDLDAAPHIRELSALRAAVTPQAEYQERLLARIATLEADLRERNSKIEELRREVERTREASLAEGRKLGLADAEDRQADRIAVLEKAVGNAQGTLSSNLSSLERLAPLLAQDCLQIVFGDERKYPDLVGDVLKSRLKELERSAILRVEVSRNDFPDQAALEALGAYANIGTVELVGIEADPGSCVIALRLGRINVGLNQQWSTIGNVLGELSLAEHAP